MKVFGTIVSPPPAWGAQSRQVRVIVAAPSQKAAVEAFQAVGLTTMTLNALRTYGGPTGNLQEIETAEAQPGVVFWSEDKYSASPTFNPAARKDAR